MEQDFALDKIDDMDLPLEILFWATTNLPSYKLLSDWVIQDQSINWPYWCVFFTWSNVSNTMNFCKNEIARISWGELCTKAVAKWYLDKNAWAYVQSSPKLLKELWFISTYALCSSLEDIKTSIVNDKPVQTWSNSIDWSATINNNNIVVEWSSYWHSFSIMWYDDNNQWLICENTYWPNAFDKWLFYLPYSKLNLLYNAKYTMTDIVGATIDNTILSNINLQDAKTAYTNWIWNWLNGTAPATREEVASMIERMYEKLKTA